MRSASVRPLAHLSTIVSCAMCGMARNHCKSAEAPTTSPTPPPFTLSHFAGLDVKCRRQRTYDCDGDKQRRMPSKDENKNLIMGSSPANALICNGVAAALKAVERQGIITFVCATKTLMAQTFSFLFGERKTHTLHETRHSTVATTSDKRKKNSLPSSAGKKSEGLEREWQQRKASRCRFPFFRIFLSIFARTFLVFALDLRCASSKRSPAAPSTS